MLILATLFRPMANRRVFKRLPCNLLVSLFIKTKACLNYYNHMCIYFTEGFNAVLED